VCCSVLQCVAVWCSVAVCFSVLQCVAVCCSVLQCGHCQVRMTCVYSLCGFWSTRVPSVAVCCSVLQCVAVCYLRVWSLEKIPIAGLCRVGLWECFEGAQSLPHCNTLQHTATHCNTLQHTATHCNTLQRTLQQGSESALRVPNALTPTLWERVLSSTNEGYVFPL